MNIDIKRISEIKDELDSLSEDDVLFIDEDGTTKYAITPVEFYDKAEDVLSTIEAMDAMTPKVKIIGAGDGEMTYEEYERVKRLINDAVEKAFKPKAEKLN